MGTGIFTKRKYKEGQNKTLMSSATK